ncbi:nose resistant to fluoxetine protein 6-like [Aphomia sociella]
MPPLFTLEEYDKCLRYDGVYCQVKLDLFSTDPNNTLVEMMKNYYLSSHLTRYNHSYLEEGICVTRTCKEYLRDKNLNDPEVIKSVIEVCRNESIWYEYGLQARVSEVYNCDRKTDERPVDALDWLVMGLFVTILLVNVSATIYSAMLKEEDKRNLNKCKKIFLCFSIFRNWKHLTSPISSDPRASKFKGINSLRFLSSFIVILVHAICIFAMEAVDNTREYERMFRKFHNRILFNGMHSVQIFFTISGFLMAYNLQSASEIQKIEWKMLPKIFVARFWRLTPSYAVIIAFTATWLRHLGSGPLWNKHVMAVSNQCRQYWWSHLLYVNNYVHDNGYCAAHTWYSGADTQMFYLGLLIHLSTQKNRRRNLVLGLFIIIGMILPALTVWYLDLHALMTFSPEFARTIVVPDFRKLYILGHNNMICYLCAMYAGYKMYEYQKRGSHLPVTNSVNICTGPPYQV